MTTRRDFFKLAAETATLAALPLQHLTAESPTPTLRRDTPLLQLQQNFVDLRFGMFLHFNMATFQDREWGDPTSSPELFHPTALDTDQWAAAAKSAHMTWGALTTRHHDGFCIWPTKTHANSVRQTSHPTDIVRAYVDSFRAANLRVGLYYSILSLRDDIRHFNITPAKIQLVKDQLTELLTNYGLIDILITDGWNAPWSRITYDEMPYAEIYRHVKQLQPNCLLSDLNASQYPSGGLYYSDIKAFEQNAGQKVPQQSDLPALSCVTLTPEWFWKQRDVHSELKPAATVVDQWLLPLNRRHCNLILNAPPTREGRLSPNVLARLQEIGESWNPAIQTPAEKITEHLVITPPNLATAKPIHASSYPEGSGPDQANDGSFESSWHLDEGLTSGWLEVDLTRSQPFNTLSLVEPVGQFDDYPHSRIKSYRFELWNGTAWLPFAAGNLPNPTTIHRIPRATAQRVRLTVEASHDTPHIAELGIYNEPA